MQYSENPLCPIQWDIRPSGVIFVSLDSYDSCQRGSDLVLVIRLIQLYWKLSLNIIFFLLGISLIFFSLHSYDSICQRGSELMLVIRLIQLYSKLSLNLQILL